MPVPPNKTALRTQVLDQLRAMGNPPLTEWGEMALQVWRETRPVM